MGRGSENQTAVTGETLCRYAPLYGQHPTHSQPSPLAAARSRTGSASAVTVVRELVLRGSELIAGDWIMARRLRVVRVRPSLPGTQRVHFQVRRPDGVTVNQAVERDAIRRVQREHKPPPSGEPARLSGGPADELKLRLDHPPEIINVRERPDGSRFLLLDLESFIGDKESSFVGRYRFFARSGDQLVYTYAT